jgi:two-component system phosphate regulon sensor histidine kinase PhoR
MQFSRLLHKLLIVCVGSNLILALASSFFLTHLTIWVLLLVVSIWTAVVTWRLATQIVRPVKALTSAAKAIAAGDHRCRFRISNRDELGELADALDRMNRELNARMRQVGESDKRKLTVLDAMAEGVIAVDADQRVILANPAAGRLFHFNPQAVIGRQLLEIVRNHALREAAQQTQSDRKLQHLEITIGSEKQSSFEVHAQPLPSEPCEGVIVVFHETTELRRLESLRRDFIANVSHELKTPLSSIKAYTETLQNGSFTDHEACQRFWPASKNKPTGCID